MKRMLFKRMDLVFEPATGPDAAVETTSHRGPASPPRPRIAVAIVGTLF